MKDISFLKAQLEELKQEHKDLDENIDNPQKAKEFSEFTLQRLKKRKLLLKDQINKIEGMLHPDIIA